MESEYEKERLENIRKNAELMQSLGLNTSTTRFRPPSPSASSSSSTSAKRIKQSSPTSSSSTGAPKTNQGPRKSGRLTDTRPDYAAVLRGPSIARPRPPKGEQKRPRRGTRTSSRIGNVRREYAEESGSESPDDGDYVQPPPQSQSQSQPFEIRRIPNPFPPTRSLSGANAQDDEEEGEGEADLPPGPPPTREQVPEGKGKGKLIFEAGYGHFSPNVTPEEMLRGGAFGGTAFRAHYSTVLRAPLSPTADLAELPPSWISTLDVPRLLTSDTYDPSVNRYGVKAGQGLREWESQGWVREQDPRGWFQWYYRFYSGRRTKDDPRQIARWLNACGPAGRFKRSLVRKIAQSGSGSGSGWDDVSVSPVVRQTLWHWAYELTEADYLAYL